MILTLSVIVGLTACDDHQKKKKMKYPITEEGETVDTYFDTAVPDPYRWLEDDNSAETAKWVNAQNDVTFAYLKQIPYREDLEKQLADLWNYEKIGIPRKRGDYIYFSKNDGLQDQDVIYRYKREGKPEEAEVFLDPNKFSEDGTTSLDGMSFSKDGNLVAYTISEGGSDWRKVILMDVIKKEPVEDTLTDVKFSGVSWKGNEGFYYASYDKPQGSGLSAKTDQHKLYYHQLGTTQHQDELIFGGVEDEKYRYVSGRVTEDGQYLVISASNATSGNNLYIQNLNTPDSDIIPIIESDDANTYLLTNEADQLYLVTDLNAPNNKIVRVSAKDPKVEHWKDFIKETDHVLQPTLAHTYIFAHYLKDAVSQVIQYDMEGVKIREVELPGMGTVNGFSSRKEEQDVYYSFTNYIRPSTIYKFDLASGASTVYQKPEVAFNPEEYESKQVFYSSKDGTKIPMMITYKKGISLDGTHPTMLYGYGGFNISLTPSFSVANALWLAQGGVYAVPNLRGGGEYGKDWHLAGTQFQKQNVFDDFIAAAEYLIDQKYTSSDYLAIRGGSNGGLLVGATMTQRPELMKVALPAVGVMDMLRYHTFTAGAGWAYDYGTAEDSKEMFDYLRGYSPVHNVKEGVAYPATLITTGDHDDRVVPAHSFKFAAELQKKQAGDHPVLIRIQTNAGHGAGKPTSMIIKEYADLYAFTLYNMGFAQLPNEEP